MRVGLSKKQRFDVFKRDGFACQYCGATPPSVILHVDHIDPVKNGGKNNIDNLVTACESCNRGKAANLLSSVPRSLKEKSEEIKERETQLLGYNNILTAKANRLEEQAWQVAAALERVDWLEDYPSRDFMSIKRFLEELPMQKILDAADITKAKGLRGSSRHFKYFCGVCWGMMREARNG